jgi:hypothetical protein
LFEMKEFLVIELTHLGILSICPIHKMFGPSAVPNLRGYPPYLHCSPAQFANPLLWKVV